MKRLNGVVPALVTPFTDTGSVDDGALREVCGFLIDAGVDCLYALGTTGECMLMDAEERERAAEVVISEAKGRVPVFVQVGAIRTDIAVRLAKHAVSVGADGIGAVTPFYYGLTEREFEEYYRSIAEAVPADFPVYLYNIPAATANCLQPEVVRRIANRHPNVIGIKNSTSDLLLIQEYLQAKPDFSVLIGSDRLFLAALAIGCDGAVSGHANVFPEPFVALYRAFQSGDLEEARRQQLLINKLTSVLRQGASMATLKAGMQFRGLIGGHAHQPLLDLTSEERERLRSELAKLPWR